MKKSRLDSVACAGPVFNKPVALFTTVTLESASNEAHSAGVKCFSSIVVVLVCTTMFCQTTRSVGDEQSLRLDIIGHGSWRHGTYGFRIYSTPDGTKADVAYLTFHSLREANQYIGTCLKPGTKVIYRQKNKDGDGNLIGERIVAVRQESGKKEFALIRRIRLNCWFMVHPLWALLYRWKS